MQILADIPRGYPGESAVAWDGYKQITPYLLELDAVSSDDAGVRKVWWQAAIAASASGDYETSLALATAAHEQWKESDEARWMTSQIGLIHIYLGKPEKGIPYLEDAHTRHRRHVSNSIADRLRSNALFDRIGLAKSAAGEAEQALTIHRRARYYAQQLSIEYPDNEDAVREVYRTGGNIAAQLLIMGDYEDALSWSKEAANGNEAICGEDHRFTHNAKVIYGQALRMNDLLPEAIDVLTRTAEGLVRITGESHHDSQKALSELRIAIDLFESSGNTLAPSKLTPEISRALGRIVCEPPEV
ncbi:MAG: tetratricopeptide repeat protein [Candidatus Saccharimonadales bacterium]